MFEYLDRSLFYKIHLGYRSEWLDSFFMLVSSSCNFNVFPLFVVAVWILFRKKSAFEVLVVYFLSGSVQFLLAWMISRPRPSYLLDAFPMIPLYNDMSFPSGHATSAFAVSFYISSCMFKNGYRNLSYLPFAWAFLVGYSRIYIGVHYPVDVLLGSVLGAVLAFLMLKHLLGDKFFVYVR